MADEIKQTTEGIVVPLTGFTGEYVTFRKEWTFADIENIGKYIPGTGGCFDKLVDVVVDWKITDNQGNEIKFDAKAIKADHSLLDHLTAKKARAITMSAFAAYNEAGKLDPLAS